MTKRLIRDSAFGMAASLITTFGNFLSTVIVARMLGVDGAGVVAYGIWLSTTLVTLASGGAPFTLSRYLPELSALGQEEDARRLNAFLLKPYLTLAALGPAALLAYAWLAPSDDGGPGLWVAIAAVTLTHSSAEFARGHLRGAQQFDRIARASLLAAIVQPIAIFAAGWRFGPAGALAGYALGNAVTASLILAAPRDSQPLPDALRRRVLRYAGYRWAAEIMAAFMWSRMETFFLQLWHGSAAVGVFAAGMTLSSLAVQLPNMLTWGLMPHFAQRLGRKEFGAVQHDLSTGTRLMAFMLLPSCFGAAAVMPALVPFIFGADFSGAVPISEILVVSAGLAATTQVAWNVIWAMERTDVDLYIGALGAAIAVAADIAIIPGHGGLGAAAARALAQISVSIIAIVFLARRLNYGLPFGDLARILLCALLCALAARATLTLIPGTVGLAPAIAVGVLAYLVAARRLKALPDADLNRFRSLAGALPAPFSTPAHRLLDVMAAPRS